MTTNKPEEAMTDRELLELAARAAGADHNGYRYGENGKEPLYGMPIEVDDGIEYRPWNPLTDDGDALRLAVALKIDIHQRVADPRVSAVAALHKPMIESCDDSTRLAATRRAIVRAAAEIGRALQ